MRQKQTSNRPTHRISFARIIGQDKSGDDVLGSAREIGSVWPRKSGGGIVRFDHIPAELTRHEGVVFVADVPSNSGDDRGFA